MGQKLRIQTVCDSGKNLQQARLSTDIAKELITPGDKSVDSLAFTISTIRKQQKAAKYSGSINNYS